MAAQPDQAHNEQFLDLDSIDTYNLTAVKATHAATLNFVVEFSLRECRVAFDLDHDDFVKVLGTSNPPGSIRWINIWTPSAQPRSIETICSRYGFSKRFQALMVFSNRPDPEPVKATHHHHLLPLPINININIPIPLLNRQTQPAPPIQDPVVDPENTGTAGRSSRRNDAFDMYDLVRETMSYTSVDQGEHFLCIGANWLHRRPDSHDPKDKLRLVPPKHWSWIALTSDCTVLSFHDAPTYEDAPEGQDQEIWRAEELKNMRSNTLAVLLQLSRHGSERNILSIKAVRPHPGQDQRPTNPTGGLRRASSIIDQAGTVSMEGSSNLFYYLFEDYTAAVPILKSTRKLLDGMTRKVLHGATRHRHPTELIPHIHKLCKELRQLQHLFESYKMLIRRVTTPRNTDPSASGALQIYADITLSQSARNRFDRLEDRLQLLMLTTIEDYLDEANALSKTYFNLTTQVDSEATARLTRATTLLAKLSVFFLPITFMTSYFSVSIDSMLEGYSGKTYWYTFAVIAGVSFFGLFFFSRMLTFFSETLEEWAATSSDFVRKLIGLLGIDVRREEDYDF